MCFFWFTFRISKTKQIFLSARKHICFAGKRHHCYGFFATNYFHSSNLLDTELEMFQNSEYMFFPWTFGQNVWPKIHRPSELQSRMIVLNVTFLQSVLKKRKFSNKPCYSFIRNLTTKVCQWVSVILS